MTLSPEQVKNAALVEWTKVEKNKDPLGHHVYQIEHGRPMGGHLQWIQAPTNGMLVVKMVANDPAIISGVLAIEMAPGTKDRPDTDIESINIIEVAKTAIQRIENPGRVIDICLPYSTITVPIYDHHYWRLFLHVNSAFSLEVRFVPIKL